MFRLEIQTQLTMLCLKAILSEQAKSGILYHNSIGNDMYKKFKDERTYGEKWVWEKMSQRKLLSFKSTAKTIKTKLEGKLITMKEDRFLLQCILVISQKRHEIDLSVYIFKVWIFGFMAFTVQLWWESSSMYIQK